MNTFQNKVRVWLIACFGDVIAKDKVERNHRFLEESLEVVQACGCTKSEALQLVDYVYGRPIGEPSQEIGGALITLVALADAHGIETEVAGNIELARVWLKIDAVREKQARKPKHSPLPE